MRPRQLLAAPLNKGLASFLEDLLQERLDGWTGRPASDAWVLNTLKDAIASGSAVRTVPFIDYGVRGVSGRSYTVGNAMFETLYDLVGEEEFKKIIGGYYQKFVNGGTTRAFIAFAKQTSRLDLSIFFDDCYTVILSGTAAGAGAVKDFKGEVLDGDSDGAAGGDFKKIFQVVG